MSGRWSGRRGGAANRWLDRRTAPLGARRGGVDAIGWPAAPYLLVALALSLVTACAPATPGGGATAATSPTAGGATFHNPIQLGGHDPWVIQDGDYYYLSESRADGSIWITKSTAQNLTDMTAAGVATRVWSRPLSAAPNCADVWAPELHRIGDRWVIYYAATTCGGNNALHRMFALESDTSDPMGTYHEAGQVTDSANRWAIDGTRFEFKGQAYFVWSGWAGETDGPQNLYIAAMSDPFTLVGQGVLISEPTYDWERRGAPINEGPEAIVTPDAVFLTYSASASWGDDYCLGMLTGRGDDLLDPAAWTKTPTAVFSRTDDVFGPGHASFTRSPDGTQDWIVYHSARASGSGWDRVLNAQPFGWADAAPVFGTPVSPAQALPVPSGQV